MGKGYPWEPWTLVSHEQWWFHSIWSQNYMILSTKSLLRHLWFFFKTILLNEILFSYTNIWSFNNECTKSRYFYKILYHPTYIHDKTLNIIELHYTGFRLIIWRINSQRNVGQRCGFSNSTSVWKQYKYNYLSDYNWLKFCYTYKWKIIFQRNI